MKLMPVLSLFSMTLLCVAGGSAAAMAQGYSRDPYAPQGQVYRDPRAYPPGYYPGKLVQPAQPQGFSLRRFFGGQEAPPQPRQPVARPRRPAPPPAAVVRQEKPKLNASSHIVVFGDALAEFVRQGLDDAFADNEDVAIVSKVKGDASLVRGDPAEWPNVIRTALDADQKVELAVVMLGLNDRQGLKEGDESVELLSERWKDLYRQRIDAILQVFRERSIPVVWIGLPPMKNGKLSENLLAMNEIYSESVERLGGAYVDIWPGFVDEDNRYTSTGPDVAGEPAKLRTNEGVFFTKAGSRKLAHFADAEIKRILAAVQAGAPVAATPKPEGADAASIEAALPAPPEAAAPAALPAKPLVGPVLPLTRPDVAPGGALISETPKLNPDQASSVQRALRSGIAPSSRPGRADDFRWPPS